MRISPSKQDDLYYKLLRENIDSFLCRVATQYGSKAGVLLDVGPDILHKSSAYFSENMIIETLDLTDEHKPTYVADLCKENNFIPSEHFDFIVCTEVLEHTLNPFEAIKELYRLLKSDGLMFASTPLNFRIHGPLPDCWRFTEHGLRSLYGEFDILELIALESPDRVLMPIQYTAVLRKPTHKFNV